MLAGISLSANAASKPNILFLVSDDLNTSLSGFGHPQCKTPNLDKLASHGVKFENMHCQYPVCGASRASMMTGLYPYTTNCLGNGFDLVENIKGLTTMPKAFMNSGYDVTRVSKIYHMGIPKEIIAGTAEHDDPASWNTAINVKAPEDNANGIKTNWSPGNKGSQSFIGVISSEGDEAHADGMAANHAIEILNQVKEGDAPFFLAVGFVRPHVPLVAPSKYFDLYDRNAMEIPYFPEGDFEDMPGPIRKYKNNDGYKVTPEGHKGLLEAYYASVSYMDAQVGRVLEALEQNNLTENTIVVFTSDHGYLLGHHNRFQKQHLFEEATRVPFILSVPWMKEQHGQSTGEMTELIDVYPTLGELAEVETPEVLQGASLKPLLLDVNSPEWTKEVAFTISRLGGETIRTKKWRYTQWYFGKKGKELYDHEKDPGEFVNQANNPEYAATLKSLQQKLNLKKTEAGFERFIKNKNSSKGRKTIEKR